MARPRLAPARARRRLAAVAAVLALVLAVACGGRGPAPIAYGERNCDYCRMTITDKRFGAQLVTAKGKVYAFDSIECLASFYLQNEPPAGAAPGAWVSDFARPGAVVRVDSARFLRGAESRSPMGLGLMAFSLDADAESVRREVGGEPMRWEEVLALVRRAGDRRTAGAHDGAHDAHGEGDAAR